jgi:murein L,D-transpeptidase YcbB/YkuD
LRLLHCSAAWLIALLVITPANADPNETIRESIDAIRYVPGSTVGTERIFSRLVLPELYERGGFELLWTTPGAEAALLSAIREAGRDGLDPADYHLDALNRAVAGDSAAAAKRDLLLTDAFLGLLYHLRRGKVDPVALDPNWNYGGDLTIDDATFDRLATAIATGDVEAAIEQARPAYPLYTQLRDALLAHREIERSGGWPSVPAGETLKVGMTDPRVVALRARLAVTDAAANDAPDPQLFDADLEEAVRRFQRRHRIAADGAVGPATLRAMNVTVGDRIDQLRVNLERVRWVPQSAAPEYVLVDVAGFRVTLVRDGAVAWRTRAVVGRPYRKTPIFSSEITYVVVNPTWTVPPGILAKDTLPAIRRDPAYLAKHDMDVLDRNGRVVDPASLDWNRYGAANFPYMIRQRPGPQNSLGLVKIMFPNEHLVYLHDTPAKTLFDKDERAFSSGCIRIERPFDLVELLLDEPRWNRTALDAVVASGRTQTITLSRPVPVVILYWTAEVDETGRYVFKPDVYDRDRAVLEALERDFEWGQRRIDRQVSSSVNP